MPTELCRILPQLFNGPVNTMRERSGISIGEITTSAVAARTALRAMFFSSLRLTGDDAEQLAEVFHNHDRLLRFDLRAA